jgi:large exoprotein involved in heme utilization and adhesion
LQNGSSITTNVSGGIIPGGNITLNTRFLIAGSSSNNDISANSENARGGNVSVNAFSISGIQPQLRPTSLSDITATGATSALSGTIDIAGVEVDLSSGLVELPVELVDVSQLIVRGCPANEGNSFVITGRGGLPPTLEQELDDDARWQDRRTLVVPQEGDAGTWGRGEREMQEQEESGTNSFHVSNTPVIEATGWQTTPTGAVILIANSSNLAGQDSLSQAIACHER